MGRSPRRGAGAAEGEAERREAALARQVPFGRRTVALPAPGPGGGSPPGPARSSFTEDGVLAFWQLAERECRGGRAGDAPGGLPCPPATPFPAPPPAPGCSLPPAPVPDGRDRAPTSRAGAERRVVPAGARAGGGGGS